MILYGTIDYAPEMARSQRIGAQNMLEDGIVDVLLPEGGGAHLDPQGFCRQVAEVVEAQIHELRVSTETPDGGCD